MGFPFSRNHTYLIRTRSYWREVRSCEIDCPRLNQPASQSETNYNHRSKASYTPKIDSKKTCNLIVGRRTFLFGAKKTGFAISSLETSQQQVNYHGFFHWRCFRPTKKTTWTSQLLVFCWGFYFVEENHWRYWCLNPPPKKNRLKHRKTL